MQLLLLAILFVLVSTSEGKTCNGNGYRTDCGHYGIQQYDCEQLDCCWSPKDHIPWCFHQNPDTVYRVKTLIKTGLGYELTLEMTDTQIPSALPLLDVSITFETEDRLHVKISDPENKRWQVPKEVSPYPDPPSEAPTNTQYEVTIADEGEEFWFAVERTVNGESLFNSSASSGVEFLTYHDQYLEIGTDLPSNPTIYGLGEHVSSLRLRTGQTYTLWNFDAPNPVDVNLYSSHPFYLDLRDGLAHGVYLRNSNGMDVTLNEQSLSYKVIGGILDFYFFLGPEPETVIQQYHDVIGRPHLPPYWALGFHQSRYGYPNIQALKDVVADYHEHKLPLDTIWSDIDYMDEYKDFTVDPTNYPEGELKAFVDQLHTDGQQYVVVIDPGIKNEESYKPYDDGVKAGVFIKDKDDKFFVGKVWPGHTVFPDFFHPDADQYWHDQIASFLDIVPVDGLWINMNEISNFCDGECSGGGKKFNTTDDKRIEEFVYKDEKDVGFNPNSPPFAINNKGSRAPLNVKTLDMDALHYDGVLEYNVHNLYGLMESISTKLALGKLSNKRPFVLTRSSFPGSGKYAAKWTGNNHATYDDLYYSISGMLSLQMFGLPLSGSDICGYFGDSNAELCARWMQLGAFYPFSRNHNNKGATSQEPYAFDEQVTDISRHVLNARYSLLPYYYTLFHYASRPISSTNSPAATVTRPLFFEFPDDPNTYDIDRQFMVGNGLLISPVLTEGAVTVSAYFPEGRWYDFFTNKRETKFGGEMRTLQAPLEKIPVHVRGGVIIPMQQPSLTTSEARKTPYQLLVALDPCGVAQGSLYLDDGISVDVSSYSLITYDASSNEGQTSLTSKVEGTYADGPDIPPLDTIVVLGVATEPSSVTINEKDVDASQIQYDSDSSSFTLSKLQLPMKDKFTIIWSE